MKGLPTPLRPLLHPKHFNRTLISQRLSYPPCNRSFHAAASLRTLDLAYDLYDNGGKADGDPILFLHGLFGNKKNHRSISKILSRDLSRPIYALDLRNHGDSPHKTTHTYTSLAEDTERFLRQHALKDATLIGHSMGAKAAMSVALRKKVDIANIVAVDNAPVDAALASDFPRYVRGMLKIEEKKPRTQKEADEILEPYAKDLPVRQFLLTNLLKSPSSGHLHFRIPVRILADNLDHMADFPFSDPEAARFEKPALFVRGTDSHYVHDDTIPIIGRFFPRFQLVDVKAGHWLISENPEGFRRAVIDFLQDKE